MGIRFVFADSPYMWSDWEQREMLLIMSVVYDISKDSRGLYEV